MVMGWVSLSRGLNLGVSPAFHPPQGHQAQLRQEEGWVLTSSQKSPTTVGGQRAHGPFTPSRMGSRPTLGAASRKSPRTVNSR